MAKGPSAVQQFEERTFREATKFVATLYKPFGKSDKREFTDYAEALREAEGMRDEFGRQAIIYALTPSGRRFPIGLSERQKYLNIWRAEH